MLRRRLLLLCLCLAGSACAATTAAQRDAPAAMPSATLFAARGGRVSWYRGPARHDLIAYDALSGEGSAQTHVYVTAPDEARPACVTCGSPVPRGFIGQPAWHPDGEHLVIQAESSHSLGTRLNHMSFGIDNDLWMIRRDGQDAHLLWRTPRRHAALHPHFDHEGRRIVFAERVPTGRPLRRPLLRRLNAAVDGENHWDGWRIRIADVERGADGRFRLANARWIMPVGPGLYETHGFTADGRLVFSHTPAGRGFVDDLYVCDVDGGRVERLTDNPDSWEEHGHYSPVSGALAFISSRHDRGWRPGRPLSRLRTELFLRRPDGTVVQLTDLNRRPEFRGGVLVSDYDWDRTGTRILSQAAPAGVNRPQLWMLRLPSAP